MFTYPEIDPVIFSLGPLQLRWYSLMYIIGMIAVAGFLRYSSKRGTLKMTVEQIEGLMIYGMLGMILGARLTYVLVYNPSYYFANPTEIPAVWKGGLSFHGAFIGICLATLIFCRKNHINYFNVTDHIALSCPVGLGFGRLGNFINGELWGRVTDSPWGMVFPGAGPLPRHPSQLYQAFTEGVVLLACVWIVRSFKPRVGVISGAWVLCYGVLRFIIEFFREPDAQLGFVLGPFSMGQVLCALMVIFGGGLMVYFANRPATEGLEK